MNQSLEWTGKTVEEAIRRGLADLGLDREDVDVDVLSEGRSGLLGIRAEDARIRLIVRQGDGDGDYSSLTSLSEDAERARDILNELLNFMDFAAEISVYVPGSDPTRQSEPGDPIVLDIEREDAGLLIGRRGQTLHHMQMLLNTIVSRTAGHYVPLRIDVEGYQQRHIYRLQQVALRAADHVRRRRRPITLEPMPPADRRIIHMTLVDNPNVVTGSTGHDEDRRVTIQQAPRGARQPVAGAPAGAPASAPSSAAPPAPVVDDDDYDDDDDDAEFDDEYDDDDYDDDDYEDDDDTEENDEAPPTR